MSTALNVKEDFNILQNFIKENNQEGIDRIYEKYGGEERFENAIINYDAANEGSPGMEEVMSTEEILAEMDRQEDFANVTQDATSILSDLDKFKNAEKEFQNYEEKIALADNIISLANLNEQQGDLLKESLGANNKGIFGTITEGVRSIGDIFTGRTDFDLDTFRAAALTAEKLPIGSENVGSLYGAAFTDTPGKEVFKDRLMDPRTQFFLRLARESGTPSFASPFARVANAAVQTGEAEQQKLLNLLKYRDKNKTTDKTTTKQIRYTIKPNDPYFSDLGFASGTPGYATVQLENGKITDYLDFSLSTQKVAEEAFDPQNFPIIESEDKRIFTDFDLKANQTQRNILQENVRLASQLDGQKGFTNADAFLSPIVEFVAQKSPDLADALADVVNREVKDFEIFKDLEANVFDLLLDDLKNLYPVSDNDMRVIKASKPLGAFGFGLRSSQLLAFKEYDIIKNQAEREFIIKNGQLNQQPTSFSNKGIEYNGKTYYTASNYGNAVLQDKIDAEWKKSGITDEQMNSWGFRKENGQYSNVTKLIAINGVEVAEAFGEPSDKIFLSKSKAAESLLDTLNLPPDPDDLTTPLILGLAEGERKRQEILRLDSGPGDAIYDAWVEKYPGLDINTSIIIQLYPNYDVDIE